MNKHPIKKYLGFTLVELIIVITILAILSTIAFVSFQNYTSKTRDTKRVTDLKTIDTNLEITFVKTSQYPKPDNYVNLTGIGYQGIVNTNLQQILNINGNLKDSEENYYTYSTNLKQNKKQLMTYLENSNIVLKISSISYAKDYTNKIIYTLGDNVGVILNGTTKEPISNYLNGNIDLSGSGTIYTAVFSNNGNSGSITGSGAELITKILEMQNSCILGETLITNGKIITSYNTQSVDYGNTCIGIQRTCINGILNGDTNYKYDKCVVKDAKNCEITSYSGYTIPILTHQESKTLTKTLSGGTADITTTCTNGNLTYGQENINCNSGYVLQNGQCLEDKCDGNAPEYSVSNGIQKYGITWSHNTTSGNCTFVCQAGYYWDGSVCKESEKGYYVGTTGQTTQTSCSLNTTYQDLTGQTSCKTVSEGYYTTPVGGGAKTGQTQCEANNYCVGGVKTSCPINTSSLAGGTGIGSCIANTQTASCLGSIASNATSNASSTSRTQTWNGSAWAPTYSRGNNATAGICTFKCNTNLFWDTSSCVKLGSNSNAPGLSCLDILNNGGSVGNGIYRLKPSGVASSFQAYCDMTTDGGGWTLVANVKNSDYTNLFTNSEVGNVYNIGTTTTAKMSADNLNKILMSGQSKLRLEKGSMQKSV